MATNRISSLLSRFAHYRHFFQGSGYVLWGTVSWLPAAIFFNEHIGEVGFVDGASMYPYLNTTFNESQTKDTCWINKWNPLENLQRGMIVTFRSPYHPNVISIKRVIALEGDKVQTSAPYPHPIVEVPPRHIWVEGDNRDGNKTLDSRYYGPISMSLITGKVTNVLWPWRSFGPIRWWEFKGRTRVIKSRIQEPVSW